MPSSIDVPRPVLTKAEMIAAAAKIRSMVNGDLGMIALEHSARASVQVANNAVIGATAGAELSVRFPSQMGSGIPTVVGTNQLDDQTLQAVAAQVKAMRPPDPRSARPANPDDPDFDTYGLHPSVPVNLWFDTTVTAMAAPPQDLVKAIVARMQDAKLVGAATIALAARATYYSYKLGLEAWAEETDAELTVTARLSDGTAAGWGGQANRDWSRIVLESALAPAISFAERGRNPVAMEPGRYTVVLGAPAVGQLVRCMAPLFDYGENFRSGAFPFHDQSSPSRTKLGQRIFDERIRMVSDPRDPDGGFLPFMEVGSPGRNVAGLPIQRMVWVEGGVLTNLAYDKEDAVAHAKPWSEEPYSVRLEAVPGTTLATTDEMIRHCTLGIYVNQLANVKMLDRRSGMMTGTTRGGCFLIQNGQIARPIKNFTFTESPIFALNKLLMIGQAERIAYGSVSLSDDEMYSALDWPPMGLWTRWPRVPMIVPPVTVQDFNFTSLAEG